MINLANLLSELSAIGRTESYGKFELSNLPATRITPSPSMKGNSPRRLDSFRRLLLSLQHSISSAKCLRCMSFSQSLSAFSSSLFVSGPKLRSSGFALQLFANLRSKAVFRYSRDTFLHQSSKSILSFVIVTIGSRCVISIYTGGLHSFAMLALASSVSTILVFGHSSLVFLSHSGPFHQSAFPMMSLGLTPRDAKSAGFSFVGTSRQMHPAENSFVSATRWAT